jgi:DNA-binding MarR family transcriptional regulator
MPKLTPRHHVPVPDLEGVDPASQGAVQALMRTMQLQRQLMLKLLADAGSQETSPGQSMCLRVLVANDGISQRDLAEMLHLARPTVTTMLQRLELSGVIERRVDPADQRLTRVHLTPTGRKLEENLRAVFAEHVRETFGPMPERDRRELERLLRALSENAERALHPTTAAFPTGASSEGDVDR